MNSFAALTLDSDDEDTPKVTKKTTTTAPAKSTKAPVVQRNIPGLAKKFTPSTTPAPDYAAEDPTSGKVNDRGGKKREMYNGHSTAKGATPNDSRAHKDRHDYARSGKVKDSTRGGRGPGGWGSVEEEARRAAKGEADVGEVVAGGDDAAEEEVVEEPVPTVFGFEEAMARREAARASSAIFGSVQERQVEAPALKVVPAKADVPDHFEGKGKKGSNAAQRSNFKKSIESSFIVQSTVETAPRDRPEGGRGAGRGGRGGDRDTGRGRGGRDGRGRGAAPARDSRAPSSKLREDDFPAL